MPYQSVWKSATSNGRTGYAQTNEYRANAWDQNIKMSGAIDWADKQVGLDLMNAWIDLYEDCDIDCQKGGS